MNRFLSLTTRFLSVCLTLALAFIVFGKASQAQAACTVTMNGGVAGGTITINSGTCYIKTSNGPAPTGVTNDSGCVGYSQNSSYSTASGGTQDPATTAGNCKQIDVCAVAYDANGNCSQNVGGVAKYGGSSAKSCGETCTTNADCRNPSANGAPVACVSGTCQNTLCAPGMTIPGANCSCGANTRRCGQTCSGALGLCGPGQGYCTYVNTAGPYCPWGWSQTYCAGSSNGYKQTACTSGDAPGGSYLVGPTGKTSGFTAAEITASCSVCGNGTMEGTEQCDDGALNGTPSSQCTAVTCMKVACNQACTTDSQCGGVQHTIRILRNGSVAGAVFAVDSVLDNGIYADGSPTLVPSGATWSVVADATAHGGSYLSSSLVGATLTYTTYSSSIVLNVKGGSTASVVDIYVDGVLTTSIKDLTTKTGWVAVPITVSATPNKYTCVTSGTAKVCRLTTNPTSTTCSGLATPTPTPVATPVPTPSALVCALTPTFTSTGNVSAWKYGDMITYSLPAAPSTMIPAGGSVRYEGEAAAYRGTTYVKTVALTPINASASQFSPMKVDVANSTYYFRFRFCVKTSAGVETCTAWGNWAAPTTTATASPVVCATPPTCPAGSSLITGTPQNGGCLSYQCLGSTTHTVKFVNKVATGRTSMVVDAIKEGSTYIENTDTNRLVFSGTWVTATDSAPSGGSYSSSVTNGNSVSFTTNQSTVYYRTYRYSARSDVDVYVDGVLKTTLTGLNTGSGWVDMPITF